MWNLNGQKSNKNTIVLEVEPHAAPPPTTHIHTAACIGKSCVSTNICVGVQTRVEHVCVNVCVHLLQKSSTFEEFFSRRETFWEKKTEKKFPIFTLIVILIKILISIHFIPFLEIRFILNVMAFVFSLFRYPQSSALRTSCFLCVCVFLVCVYASIIQCVFF